MSDEKHTPGPWRYERKMQSRSDLTPGGYAGCIVGGPEEYIVADIVSDVPELKREAKQNAALIAAAPDLLEALRELELYADECALLLKQHGFPNKAQSLEKRMAKARAALSKSQAPAAAGDRTTGEPPAPFLAADCQGRDVR